MREVNTKTNKWFYSLASMFSLVLGIGIYLLFRNTDMLLFQWIPKLEFLKNLYIPVVDYSIFNYMLLFILPDALWFLSGILFFRFFWFNNKKYQRIYIFCFYVIAIIFEMCQIIKIIPGTFDILDLLFIVITAFVEGLLYKIFILRRFV